MAVVLQQIPSYKVGRSAGRYANVKSKIDQSDPNPAHKLKRTLSDLTSDSEQGREINPRFSSATTTAATSSSSRYAARPDLQRRSRTVDYNGDRFPRSFGTQRTRVPSTGTGVRSSAAAVLRKSGSLDSPLHPASSKEFSPVPSSLSQATSAAMTTKCEMSELAEEEEEEVEVKREKEQSGGDNGRVSFEEAEEDEFLSGASVEGSELGRRVINPVAFAFIEEESDAPSKQEGDETAPLFLDEGEDDDLGICGVEVTNSSTETTVVLKHLLALSGRRSQSHGSSAAAADMAIIEEDELEEEEEYYESKDTPLSPSSSTVESFALPHPIPRLIVTCEGEGLVETVVDVAREYSAEIPLYGIAENNGVLSTRL